MKFALVNDTHFGVRNDNLKVAAHQKKFYDEVFFPYLREHNINHIVHLGDVFDRRKYISFTSLRAAKEMFFDPAQEYGISIDLLVGNHDSVYRNTLELNSIELLCREYDRVTEHSSPKEIELDECKFLLIPWICNDNELETVDLIKETQAQIVLGHLELSGFAMNKGYIQTEGRDHQMFEKFDMVCTGHYHHRSSDKNIYYLGAPYEMTWQDYEDDRGFHVFDTKTRDLARIENPLKLFHKIWYDDEKISIDDIPGLDFSQCNSGYVKVIVTNKTNPYMFDMFISKLEDCQLINLQIVEDHLHLDLDNDEDIIDEAEDTVTILDNYVEGLEINANKDKVKTVLRTLYNEALTIT